MLGRKVIYLRCINSSYNNVAKGIRLLDMFCLYRNNFMQVRAFERYIPLSLFCLAFVMPLCASGGHLLGKG